MKNIWDEIFEQNKAKEVLTSIYNSRRVPHAFLFVGQEGIGKFYSAIQFAKLLNSRDVDRGQIESINKKISSLQEPYIKLILPLPRGKNETGEDSGTEKLSADIINSIQSEINTKIINPYHRISVDGANTIKINSIREIRKFISLSVDDIKYRMIIVTDAHLMNENAQNSLLKNLEEPPEGVIFILITSQPDKLLPTIHSRCWKLNFEPLSEPSIQEILIKYFKVEKSIAQKISSFSEGSPLIGYSLISQFDINTILEKTVSVLRYSLAKRYNSAHKELVEFIHESSDDSLKILIRMIKAWLNDSAKNKVLLSGYYFEEYRDTFEKFNIRYNKANVERIFANLENLENYQDRNVNLNVLSLNLIFELTSLSIGY
jgi:DNA polymerase III subunit delta'